MRCNHCMKEVNDGIESCPYCGGNPAEPNPPHQLAAGTVLNDRYLIGNALGEGGFGITYVGFDLTLEIKTAVKEYFPAGYANRNNTINNKVTLNLTKQNEYFKNGRESFLREAKNVAKFSNERGIVDVRDFFTANNTAYIVMQFLDGKTLSRTVYEQGVIKADELITLLLPLMRSLEKMHSENIIHRDISPDNIMYLTDGTLKLMDFGAARYYSDEGAKTMSVLLKPGYAPYEQYSRKGNQGPWTDVYGLCATIYKCITGKTPPDSLDRARTDELAPPSRLGAEISPQAEQALMRGLAVYPEDRLQSMGELIAAMTAQQDMQQRGSASAKSVKEQTVAADAPVDNDKSDRTKSADAPVGYAQADRTKAADVPVDYDKSYRTKAADQVWQHNNARVQPNTPPSNWGNAQNSSFGKSTMIDTLLALLMHKKKKTIIWLSFISGILILISIIYFPTALTSVPETAIYLYIWPGIGFFFAGIIPLAVFIPICISRINRVYKKHKEPMRNNYYFNQEAYAELSRRGKLSLNQIDLLLTEYKNMP